MRHVAYAKLAQGILLSIPLPKTELQTADKVDFKLQIVSSWINE
jgi:hypothetical protein